ncbi:GNAT family N-acetyltransferase [Oceanobacillus limi]|uniref:GNAT family N-acetyltransferase n=1 Tax=Oceanobacillus limi TaxID=930131 RepID=UPI003CC7A60F
MDLLFTHKNFQGKGIATKLLQSLERTARTKGMTPITTEASITAKPFFLAKGFDVVRKQNKCYQGIEFVNFVMAKTLV